MTTAQTRMELKLWKLWDYSLTSVKHNQISLLDFLDHKQCP